MKRDTNKKATGAEVSNSPRAATPTFHPTIFEGIYPAQIEGWDPAFSAEYRGTYGDRWKPSWSTYNHPRNGNTHKGIDLYASFGTPLVSVADGQIEYVRDSESKDDLGDRAWLWFSLGGRKWRFIYGHLSRFEGDNRAVRRGEVIGYAGCSGNAIAPTDVCNKPNVCRLTSTHCHLAVRDADNLIHDPLSLLGWKLRYADDLRDILCRDLKASDPVFRMRTIYGRQRELLEQLELARSDRANSSMKRWRLHLLDLLEAGSDLIEYPDNVDTTSVGRQRVSQFLTLLNKILAVTDADRPSSHRDNVARFLLHMAWHEGQRLTQRKQLQDGPARSFFQLEATRAKDAVAYTARKAFLGEAANAAKAAQADIEAGRIQL